MSFRRLHGLPGFPVRALAASLCLSAADAGALPTPSVGLSTVRAEMLTNSLVGQSWPPQLGEELGRAVATGDFNDDGVDDLAIGIPRDNGPQGGQPGTGCVRVYLGIAGRGIDPAVAPSILRLHSMQPDAAFGSTLAVGDFNGDQIDDLAVGAPRYGLSAGGSGTHGVVALHFGNPAGIVETSTHLLDQGGDHPIDRFGTTLAAGDFNGDSVDDLAVGMPIATRQVGGVWRDGGVVRLFLGPDLEADPGSEISQLEAMIPGSFEAGDEFGYSLSAGNFNGDQRCGEFGCAPLDDLAIGVPGEDFSAGKVLVLFGSPWSLLLDSALWYGEGDLGGTVSSAARFAHALAAGDFDGDALDDLLVGAPHKSVGAAIEAGEVTVLFGMPTYVNGSWFDLNSTRRLNQTVFYGAAANAHGDCFGESLAVGDFDQDGYDDAVVGHPGEDILGGGISRGGFSVLTGSPANPHGPGRYSRFFGAGYAGVPLPSADLDQFGEVLATGDLDGDGHADLAIGVPRHDHPEVGHDVGAAVVLHGALFADGVEWGGSLLFWSAVQP